MLQEAFLNTERQTDRQTETDRESDRDRQTETDRESDRDRQTDRGAYPLPNRFLQVKITRLCLPPLFCFLFVIASEYCGDPQPGQTSTMGAGGGSGASRSVALNGQLSSLAQRGHLFRIVTKTETMSLFII